jgi:hypothetical protein
MMKIAGTQIGAFQIRDFDFPPPANMTILRHFLSAAFCRS